MPRDILDHVSSEPVPADYEDLETKFIWGHIKKVAKESEKEYNQDMRFKEGQRVILRNMGTYEGSYNGKYATIKRRFSGFLQYQGKYRVSINGHGGTMDLTPDHLVAVSEENLNSKQQKHNITYESYKV